LVGIPKYAKKSDEALIEVVIDFDRRRGFRQEKGRRPSKRLYVGVVRWKMR